MNLETPSRTANPRRRRAILLAVGAVAVVLLLGLSFAPGRAAPAGPLRISYINVGEGDSALIRDPAGFTVLIDGGPPAAGPTVVAYLRGQGVTAIDVMLATHPDSDHIGGLIDVLAATDIPVRQVLYNGYAGTTGTWSTFATAVAKEGLALEAANYPADYQWGAIASHVLNPAPGLVSPETNDACVVTRLDYGSERFLFPCDISSTVEATVLARLTPVAAAVLKVSHHGSAGSSSAGFLSAAGAADAVISVGPNNYGLPAPETLGRLAAAGARVWRTDRSGTIVLVSDGSTYGITPEISAAPGNGRVYLPLLARAAASATVTPTPPSGSGMPGQNIACQTSGAVELCVSVSNAAPGQNSMVTIYGRLQAAGAGQAGQAMTATWHFKSTTPTCGSTTDGGGLAACSRSIGAASLGYQVNVDVTVGGYAATTWFTPQ